MKSLALLTLLIFSFNLKAEMTNLPEEKHFVEWHGRKFLSLKVAFKKGDTLTSLMRLFVNKKTYISKRVLMVRLTLNKNSHIDLWKKAQIGDEIIIYIDTRYLNWKKYRRYIESSRNEMPRKHHDVSFQSGTVQIEKDADTLDLMFHKFIYSYSNKLNSSFNYGASVKLTKFSNLDYSAAQEAVSPSDVYFEFSFKLSPIKQYFKKVSITYHYDLLHYFVLAGQVQDNVVLSPIALNRIGASGLYHHSARLKFFSMLGFLKSFGENDITGFDISAGGFYSLGRERLYRIGLAIYSNWLNTNTSDEQSKAISLSGGYRF